MKRIILAVLCCSILVSVVAAQNKIAKAKNDGSGESIQVLINTKQSDTSAIPILARAGDEFVVTLASNVTTGYKWQLSGKPNSGVVVFVKSVNNEPNQAIPDRGGSESWTFKAIGKGSTNITLQYIRPWEKKASPAKV